MTGWLAHEHLARAERICAGHAEVAEKASVTTVDAMQTANEAMRVSANALELSTEITHGLVRLEKEVIEEMKEAVRKGKQKR